MNDKVYIRITQQYYDTRGLDIIEWLENIEWYYFEKGFDLSIDDGNENTFMFKGLWLNREDAIVFKLRFGDVK